MLNESGVGPGENGPPGMPNTTTYAGGNNPKGYSQPSQNIADQAGKVHDQNYDKEKLAGFPGMIHSGSYQANIILVQTCDDIVLMHAKGEIDPYTGAKVSDLTLLQARLMKAGFTYLEHKKVQ